MKYFAEGVLLIATSSIALSQIQQSAVRPEFEVASVKPNVSGSTNFLMRPPAHGRFTATNVPLKLLIALAYQVRPSEISGGPAWIVSDKYDVNGKAADSNVNADQSRFMLQRMLEDRFKLMVHRETKEMPVYVLLPAKNGLKVQAAKEGSCVESSNSPRTSTSPPICGSIILMTNGIAGRKMSMAQLANSLSGIVGPPVIDKTGYAGYFDFQLEFSRELTAVQANVATPADTSEPSIFTALQEQLGMKLEATKGPVEVLVIDRAERASAN